jgi:hypothetical protein
MQMVTVVPFWLYLIFVMVAFSLGVYVVGIALLLGFLYVLIRAPFETIKTVVGLLLLSLTFQYWKITLPLFLIIGIFLLFSRDKNHVSSHTSLQIENLTGRNSG